MPPAAFAPAAHGATARPAHSAHSSSTLGATKTARVASSNATAANTASNATAGAAVSASIAPRAHRPRVLVPSHYSQEKVYISDTTGPMHHSLRGSRPVLFPKATREDSAAAAAAAAAAGEGEGHLSNPNERLTRPHQFQHAPIRAPKEWAGERSAVMKSSVQVEFTARDPAEARAIPVAGTGGRIAQAQAASSNWAPRASDAITAPTPLQSLAAARHTDLLQAARNLQAKAAAAQQAADRLFETSARERYEVARKQNTVNAVNFTSPFFLGKPGASATIGVPQTHRERRLAPTAKIGTPVRPSSASAAGSKQRLLQQQQAEGEAAGLNVRRIRDWASDPTLRLVARADAGRAHDDYGNTFARIVSDDPTRGGARNTLSTTAESLRAGRAPEQRGEGGKAFVPHFLAKVHPSLHNNVRRNVFTNGNDFIDPLGSSSKFQTARFVPRAYNSDAFRGAGAAAAAVAEASVPASTQQPSQVAQPTVVAHSSDGAGSGFVAM